MHGVSKVFDYFSLDRHSEYLLASDPYRLLVLDYTRHIGALKNFRQAPDDGTAWN